MFKKGFIINERGKRYIDGIYKSNVVKDHLNRFGKNVEFAICAVWKTNKNDGILAGWFRDNKLVAEDKVMITRKNGIYYMEPCENNK
jgi:hypothetical protein